MRREFEPSAMSGQFKFGDPIPKDTIVKQSSPKDFYIEYRDYLILDSGNWYGFRHVDYDGPGDSRYGHSQSLQEAKQLIDEQIESA